MKCVYISLKMLKHIELVISVLQINLKGLDGIQGPVYVGTGCVFKRQALYGYDPPPKDISSKKGHSSSWCCGPRKTGHKQAKCKRRGKLKKSHLKRGSATPIFSLEDIEEGIEGMIQNLLFISNVRCLV